MVNNPNLKAEAKNNEFKNTRALGTSIIQIIKMNDCLFEVKSY